MSVGKSLFDRASAALGLLVLWPFFLVVAVFIKRHDGGPVFFRQERVGFRGQPFRIWKFRTMVVNAERMGGALTIGRDPRITPIGHFLRKTKLDEIPQLINVVMGEMSLVGPRPEVAHYVALYSREQRRVLELIPGMTDPASLRYFNESEVLATAADPEAVYVEKVMPEKIRINLEYAASASLISDIGVVIRTVLRCLS